MPIELTDTQLETAIRTSEVWGANNDSMVAENGIVTGDITDQYDGDPDQFSDAVTLVWIAISQGPLEHTHNIHLVWDAEHTGKAQLQVTLPQEGYVAASWREPSELTDDHEAAGITGLVAIARALVRAANKSLDIARPLVLAQLESNTRS